MAIFAKSFETAEEEIFWVTQKIQEYLESGIPSKEIAIISRKHATLAKFQTLLSKQNVIVNYERSDNILDNPGIRQIINLAKYIDSLIQIQKPNLEYLLPEILSYEFWGLTTEEIWKLAVQTSQNRTNWITEIKTNDNPKIKKILEFLIEVAQKAKTQTGEEILDLLIGNTTIVQTRNIIENENTLNSDETTETDKLLISPFRQFYFKNNSNDLELLSALKSLYEAIRNHTQKEIFYLSDMLEYLDLVAKNNLKIYNKSSFYKNPNGLNLLTAHKAKGLEFEIVFVINAVKSEWESRGNSSKITFPNQIQIAPDKDDKDDFIRLFYVATTRAKNQLFITKSIKDEAGKDKVSLTFEEIEFEPVTNSEIVKKDILEQFQIQNNSILFTQQLKDLLVPVVTNYKLSVSGLLNFIDLTKGGPQYFLQNNLLRFPQAKAPTANYGTAVHATIRDLYKQFKLQNNLPNLEYFLETFKNLLAQQNLNQLDFSQYLDLGQKELAIYYNQRKNDFKASSVLEMNFNNQEVHLEEAVITGQIDKMDIETDLDQIIVTDFKTGKAVNSFEPGDEASKKKIWNYRLQLVFYKLLIENSAIYGQRYKVKTGEIEFIKPTLDNKIIVLNTEITEAETQELQEVVKIVYNKIINLDFPDTTNYEPNLKGNLAFINDLLNHKI